jgi:hypothetical protein
MDQALFLGVLRHVLQLAAGALVTKGFLDGGSAEALVGGGISFAAVGWYVWGRRAK